MKIRQSHLSEIEKIVEIWYQASLRAHDFIHPSYWASQKGAMAEDYLPRSENFVISQGGRPVGFISMLDDYLAALFIDPKSQGKGCGSALLDFIKGQRDRIELRIYQKNKGAVQFYLGHDFFITGETLDEATGEAEYMMVWKRDKN